MMSQLFMKEITKTYGEGEGRVEALRGISLDIESGEMVAIMGASGSGKSTLLNLIGCLDIPTGGSYKIDGNSISQLSSNKLARLRSDYFGFVVQYFALVDDYTVYQNIILPVEYSRSQQKRSAKERANKLIEQLGLHDKLKAYPRHLSGGQCQRVAIARALINNPQVILADEPTGALDRKTGEELMDLLKQIHETGKTILLITHDEHVANRCDRIITIADGRIVSY